MNDQWIEFADNIETIGIAFFGEDSIPDNLAVEKCTEEQILMCFESHKNRRDSVLFD